MKPNRYILLRIKILLAMMRRGKVSIRKLVNFIACQVARYLGTPWSGGAPFMVSFELWNECNSNCIFCRTADGLIHDQRPGSAANIPKGMMPIEMYEDILRQLRKDLLMAVLYVNGEPLLYKDIYRAVRLATDSKVATLIATNGTLLTEENCGRLLDAGLDFIKIAVSGFSQQVYGIQHRHGDIEKIKAHIDSLVRLNRQARYGCLVMLDYIRYTHSASELELFRQFCLDRGIMFNVRPGNIKGMEDTEPDRRLVSRAHPLPGSCDFPWHALTVNWNGDVFPCCDFVVWSGKRPLGRHVTGETNIRAVWNGSESAAFRTMLHRKRRTAIDICARCDRTGTAFKY